MKGQKVKSWKERKHECEDVIGPAWRRQRQGNRKAKSQVRSVLRQVAVNMGGQDELTEKKEGERSEDGR